MPRKRPNKVDMPVQPPHERKKNFDEVALGYTEKQAMEEALRCLNCKNARCVEGCPVGVPIPEFITKIAEGKPEEAYKTIFKQNTLPAICGRVCPQESQCEAKCIRANKGEPVAIGRLERFAADFAGDKELTGAVAKKRVGRVAVVGSGPAGLTCAGELARMGYSVTIFEALHAPGGVLLYGIPEFRLPRSLVEKEIRKIKDMGVEIVTNVIVGRSITIPELFEDGYQAVFVASGAGLPKFMEIPGENLNGVYSANEFLTRVNLMKAYDFPNNPTPIYVGKNAVVVGGGNVAMDAARTAKRLGAKNTCIIYRRGMEEMPARREEIDHAQQEGIEFKTLTHPIEIMGEDGWVKAVKCVEMELGKPDASGRRRPIEKPGSEFTVKADTVIIAIGQSPNPLIRQTTQGLKAHKWGGLVVDEDTMGTSMEGVYAGGDVVTGAATVIMAMGAGKKAAKAIDEYLQSKGQRLN
ncbi:NADPH-dependent glutamate synthase [Desulfofalx alkaliphila]|uniref:NADPH-dependent glutamate synthase n=1 Tax=Desulfofalx alkaliphila TaxID=105483 RepID=UPI0004E0D4C6|nr:NADPH-dependent glutamate synthase [Desulfofalx alkaliphila]